MRGTPAASQAHPDVERAFRDVSGQAVATLARIFGDIGLAEDAVQDAFVVAMGRWAADGVPPNPAGWVITTARNRAIDRLRRTARGRELYEEVGVLEQRRRQSNQQERDGGPVQDDQLRLMFTCCHPALRTEHQVALTLRLLGGLSVGEIARSFLVTESAMAKRLVRAKHKISAANIPYRIPAAVDLPERLHAVLSVLYLVYNTGADDLERTSLCADAVRLARALVGLMPDEPEAAGLLALMLLNESRRVSRTVDGVRVPLADQDRSRWNRGLIGEGHGIVRMCIRRNRPGPFQLQAAIQAVHCAAPTFADTDWRQVLTLYDRLYAVMPTPIVALNRAIALSEVDGPQEALAQLEPLVDDLAGYAPFHASRAAMLARLGERHAAASGYQRAAELAPTETDRRFLTDRLEEVLAVG